jgi:hypothetical protein
MENRLSPSINTSLSKNHKTNNNTYLLRVWNEWVKSVATITPSEWQQRFKAKIMRNLCVSMPLCSLRSLRLLGSMMNMHRPSCTCQHKCSNVRRALPISFLAYMYVNEWDIMYRPHPIHDHSSKLTLSPGSFVGGEKSLIHTVCTCV